MADDEKTPTLEEQVAALKQQLDAATAKNDVLEKTFNALNSARETAPARSATPTANAAALVLSGLGAEDVQFLKSRLGAEWTDADIQKHWAMFQPFIERMAGPLVNQISQALVGLGDYVDRHDALLDVPEYKDLRSDVEQEIRTRAERGERPMSRRELTQMVRARKLPELIEQRAKEQLEDIRKREAAGGAAETQDTAAPATVQKPTRESKPKSLDLNALDPALSHEQRAKAIEDAYGDAVIP